MKYFMKTWILLLLSFVFIKTQAQQKHFIYIESEDRQPFAVVLDGKVFSSSDYCYVVVPKLTDGTYNFTVSFPMNKYPDQSFKCIINKKDVGYKLQNDAAKGWSLQNMQSQKILNGNGETPADNAFGNMLSDVVNDSNLTNKNLPFNNVRTDTVGASANIPANTNTTSTQNPAVDALNNTTAISTDSVAQPEKISETKLDTGTNLVFVDKSSGTDTIRVFVPSDSVSNFKQSTDTVAVDNSSNQQSNITSNTESNEMQKADTTTASASNPFYKPITDNNITSKANTNNTPAISNAVRDNCSNMISDNDIDKIKRKMFVQNNDNGMIQTALRYVNDKCITTEQVKTLGNIFSSDDGRYNLYEALFKHVYDYGNYANLESQIIDPYYKKRFEVMLQ